MSETSGFFERKIELPRESIGGLEAPYKIGLKFDFFSHASDAVPNYTTYANEHEDIPEMDVASNINKGMIGRVHMIFHNFSITPTTISIYVSNVFGRRKDEEKVEIPFARRIF